MARRAIEFSSETTKNFVPNQKRGAEYVSTIQNNTDQTITITVTNQDIQASSPTYTTPASGAVVIIAGAMGSISEPYDGWLLTAGASATGTVDISEAG